MNRGPVGLVCAGLLILTAGHGVSAETAARSQAADRQSGGKDQKSIGAGIPYSVGRALPDKAANWTRAPQIRMYGPGDLWEYIDGAAEQYLAFGFQDLASAKYTHATGGTVAVDIYRMVDAVNAFGIYTQEASPKTKPVAIGVEGRAGSSTLRFWSGCFYVRITAPSGTSAPQAEMVALGTAVAGGLGPPGGLPSQLKWFPARGLVPGSIRFLPADALGQSTFANAFEANYEQAPEPSTLVVVPFAGEDKARAAMAGYETFLAGSGRPRRKLTAPADGGFSIQEGYYGLIVAVRSGSSLIISLGAADEGAASALISEVVGRMRPVAPGPGRKGGVS